MRNRNTRITVLIWTALTISLYGQFVVIKHLRHNLLRVAGFQRGMYSAQMMEHDLLLTCRLALAQAQGAAAVAPVSQACCCENPGGGLLDSTPPVTPFF